MEGADTTGVEAAAAAWWFAEIYRALSDSAPVRDENGGLPVADEATVEVAARALKRWRKV